jgi:hypothetical protein
MANIDYCVLQRAAVTAGNLFPEKLIEIGGNIKGSRNIKLSLFFFFFLGLHRR